MFIQCCKWELFFSFKTSYILKEYKIQKTIVNVSGILFKFNIFHLVHVKLRVGQILQI